MKIKILFLDPVLTFQLKLYLEFLKFLALLRFLFLAFAKVIEGFLTMGVVLFLRGFLPEFLRRPCLLE